MKWLKFYPKNWRDRYEEEFLFVYENSGSKGMKLKRDMVKHFITVWCDELLFKKGRKTGAVATFLYAFITYMLIISIALLLPTSEEYDVITWKIFIAQVYALPTFLAVLIALKLRNRRINLCKN